MNWIKARFRCGKPVEPHKTEISHHPNENGGLFRQGDLLCRRRRKLKQFSWLVASPRRITFVRLAYAPLCILPAVVALVVPAYLFALAPFHFLFQLSPLAL